MDPVTHTLVGGSLAATRLGEKTRLATAALVIGANLPDIDVVAFVGGTDAALALRRGWTHGVLALAVLPALLTGLLLCWGRWRAAKEEDPPLAPGWLLALCYLAVLTHPALDWLNTYGMRWWMPFDGTWYYGDSVFIVDPWLWLILGTGWLIGRRPSWPLLSIGVALAALLLSRTLDRAPEFALSVGGVLLLLLAVLIWQPGMRGAARRAATGGLALAVLFIGAMIALHAATTARVRSDLERQGIAPLEDLMVGPMPANPLAWDVIFIHDGRLRAAYFEWVKGGLQVSSFEHREARSTEIWRRILATGEPAGFLGWTRFPWVEPEASEVFLMDARYTRERTRGFGGAVVDRTALPNE